MQISAKFPISKDIEHIYFSIRWNRHHISFACKAMQIKTNLWDFHDHLSICIYSYTYNSNVFSTYVEYVSNEENEKLFLSNFSYFSIDDIHSAICKNSFNIRNETDNLICILDLKFIQLLKCRLSPINGEKMLKKFFILIIVNVKSFAIFDVIWSIVNYYIT